jgi:hypothetical protein
MLSSGTTSLHFSLVVKNVKARLRRANYEPCGTFVQKQQPQTVPQILANN